MSLTTNKTNSNLKIEMELKPWRIFVDMEFFENNRSAMV